MSEKAESISPLNLLHLPPSALWRLLIVSEVSAWEIRMVPPRSGPESFVITVTRASIGVWCLGGRIDCPVPCSVYLQDHKPRKDASRMGRGCCYQARRLL